MEELTKNKTMTTRKSPLSIRILYWMTNIAFWIITLVGFAVLLLNFVLLTDVFTEDIQLRVKMPVSVEVVEDGSLTLRDSELTVRIEEAHGKLHFVDTPIFITRIVAKILLVVLGFAVFITWKLKEFITNLKNGLLFEIQNINNLKHIAYAIVGLWLVTRIYMGVLFQTVVSHMKFNTIRIGSEVSDFDDILIVALILWALAHVFLKGLEMKSEQELTI